MGVADIADDLLRLAEDARDSAAEMLFEPRLALGVTGLSRAGKTVFITSLIANLMARGRMTQLSAEADGRLTAVAIPQHPDRETPRFAYEAHLAALSGAEPVWPESTRRVSQIRLSLKYRPTGFLSSLAGPGVMHLDIIDYPGEWLLDLGLLDLDFAAWSSQAIAKARARPDAAQEWLALVENRAEAAAIDEAAAETLADAFRGYLSAARKAGYSGLPPGRFLMPGDLEGSPALTFCPLPEGPRDAIWREFSKRFEAYKRSIVKPFFRNHFARLDRQVVLVDLMTALADGPAAVADLSETMVDVLAAFRPGRQSWLSSILGKRIDRILFAATKADHLHHSEHDRLTRILASLLNEAVARAAFKGAETDALAIAALRATVEQDSRPGGRALRAVRGRRLADGKEIAIDPGELPSDPAPILAAARAASGGQGGDGWLDGDFHAVSFAPPPLTRGEGLPHIRLDRALEFLIGDRIA